MTEYLFCVKISYVPYNLKWNSRSLLQPTWPVRPPNSCAWTESAFQRDGVVMVTSIAWMARMKIRVRNRPSDHLATIESSCALPEIASTLLGSVMATRTVRIGLTKPTVSRKSCVILFWPAQIIVSTRVSGLLALKNSRHAVYIVACANAHRNVS